MRTVDQAGLVGQFFGADDEHLRRMLADELHDLEHARAEQRIEQERQHGDHEQRPTVAQLVAHLALEDQLDVGPVHRRVIVLLAIWAGRRSVLLPAKSFR